MYKVPSNIVNIPRLRALVVALLLVALWANGAIGAETKRVRLISLIAIDEFMGRLKEPGGLFYDGTKKRLYVADSGNKRLVSFDEEFRYLSELSHRGFSIPLGIVKTSAGEFYITDAKTGEIKFVDVKNKAIVPLKIKGLDGKKKFVAGRLSLDEKENLVVTDRLNKRILILKRDGTLVKAIEPELKGLYGFSDVKVDSRGYIYAVDTIGRKVYIFDNTGRLVRRFGTSNNELMRFPVSVAVDSRGYIYVLDRHSGRILVFNDKGVLQHLLLRKGVSPGELYNPGYIYIDGKNRIYTIDGNRVQIFLEGD